MGSRLRFFSNRHTSLKHREVVTANCVLQYSAFEGVSVNQLIAEYAGWRSYGVHLHQAHFLLEAVTSLSRRDIDQISDAGYDQCVSEGMLAREEHTCLGYIFFMAKRIRGSTGVAIET